MKSSRSGGPKNRSLSSHTMTLHQRLHQALGLGIKYTDGGERKWHCTDVEVQMHVVRSMASFMGCISSDLVHHPLIKGTVVDMVLALCQILQSGNDMVLSITTSTTSRLIELLGKSMFQYDVSELVGPLSNLLSSTKPSIVAPSTIALNGILSAIPLSKTGRHNKMWQTIEGANAVATILCVLQDSARKTLHIELEHLKEMLSLLRTILWHWQPSRYLVWSNSEFMSTLGALCTNPEPSVSAEVLQIYSALALCGSGAARLLEGESILNLMVNFMRSSQPQHVRVEAFKLFQHLSRSKEACSKTTNLHCKSIVKCIVNAMNDWRSHSAKVPNDQIPLVVEACRSALITRWSGDHHLYFWKYGIVQTLLDLVLNKSNKINQSLDQIPLKELKFWAEDVYPAGLRHLRPYIWYVLGWLVAHCPPNFDPKAHGDEVCLKVLSSLACLLAVKAFQKGVSFSNEDLVHGLEDGPVCHAVLLMICSPCNYIASQVRNVLSEAFIPIMEKYPDHLLRYLELVNFIVSDSSKVIVNLIGSACYINLVPSNSHFPKIEVIELLISLLRKHLSDDWEVTRSCFAPYLQETCNARTCCWILTEEWEGWDFILLFGLWALLELLWTTSEDNCQQLYLRQVSPNSESENVGATSLANLFRKACSNDFSPGVRWLSACCLGVFGFYGFPCALGERMKKALIENKFADLDLLLPNGRHSTAHKIVLMLRCPSLLPSEIQNRKEKDLLESSSEQFNVGKLGKKFMQEVRLSSHVDSDALLELLEFVYAGYVQVDNDVLKQLKILAKHCNLLVLSDMLYRRRPRWGSKIPTLDFTLALREYRSLSDIILEVEQDIGISWSCMMCYRLLPHMHVHKIILQASSDYLLALFQSGMQDSTAQSIKVPISWKALSVLVSWFYSGELARLNLDCMWKNLDKTTQLQEVRTYIELCWLSEFWFLEGLLQESFNVILSCLKTNDHLALHIIQIAANFSQWKVVEAASNHIAHLYPKMRNSGDLEIIDENLCDIVRASFVRLSQGQRHRDD